MPDRIPPSLMKRIEENPPEYHRRPKLKTLLDGDLDSLVKAYAKAGTYNGNQGAWWGIWLALQEHQGKPIATAILDLSSEQIRWFATWAFAKNRADEGAAAYRRYLEKPGKIGPFSTENVLFLDYLLANEEYHETISIADHFKELWGQAPSEELRAIQSRSRAQSG